MSEKTEQETAEQRRVLVWDLPTRLFHWCLFLLVGASWATGEMGEMEWHMRSGIAILTLLLFRLLWGFYGSTTARFVSFVTSPLRAISYGRDLAAGKAARYLGHNPLGGWMVVVLILLLLSQAATGLFSNDDIFTEGPLYHLVTKATSDYLTGLHKTLFDLLLVCVAIHVAASLFYLFVKKENLILPMIHGFKRGSGLDQAGPVRRGILLASISLAAAAAVVWAVLSYA